MPVHWIRRSNGCGSGLKTCLNMASATVAAGGDAQELLRHGQQFVELFEEPVTFEALQVYKALRAKPGLVPDGAVVTLMLANMPGNA